MKRRNDCGKVRRPTRRSKITEGIIGSLPINSTTLVYLKFLIVWTLVLVADSLLEFRFEYLWPFWLLVRSVYDSFKYQGLAFSVFFVIVALTSDMICFLFIPVHWLFFVSSTYVWVQYVWHTERGICLPTVSLWLLFVYVEASVRLKELKSLPFHLDLCRPFAAHCIGYPVVTLGFGFKSYVSYRMRLRKQKEIAKENSFYVELLEQALPQQEAVAPLPACPSSEPVSTSSSSPSSAVATVNSSVLANGKSTHSLSNGHTNGVIKKSSPTVSSHVREADSKHDKALVIRENGTGNSKLISSEYDAKKNSHNGIDKNELQYMEHHIMKKTVNDFIEDNEVMDSNHKNSYKSITACLASSKGTGNSTQNSNSHSSSSSSVSSTAAGDSTTPPTGTHSSSKWTPNHMNGNCVTSGTGSSPPMAINGSATVNSNSVGIAATPAKGKARNMVANNLIQKEDHLLKNLEADIKRLKADLQASRQVELELRGQVNTFHSSEVGQKAEICQLQQDNENLQNKLHNLVTARQQDKQTVSQLEKKLQDEKKTKSTLESQLASERKIKKSSDESVARVSALATVTSGPRTGECTESCKSKRRDVENDLKQVKRELKLREDQLRQMEREAHSLRQYKDSHGDTEILMSALSAMQDKNSHLENSLSAETRLKLDLFSALGDTKRQLEIAHVMLAQKDKEIDELKSKIAEVMAVMPPTTSSYSTLENSLVSSILYNTRFMQDSSRDSDVASYGLQGVSSDLSN
ncbi:Macoilin [Halotydeus destructor]|nr:Macoilin [Halotydeus destructor]